MTDDSIVYVAIAPCGCLHGIECETVPEAAEQVADWIKRGSVVDRMGFGHAKDRIVMDCPHWPAWGRA